VEKEMWDIWQELSGGDLPLPLGGMVLSRSIPLLKAIEIEKTLTHAVAVARKHKHRLSEMLLERNLVRIDAATLDTYLELYANDDSISLNDTQIKALDTLYKLGYDAGFYDTIIKTDDFFIPTQYEEQRFS
jgi:1,4-dihydroxy-6-naphthoate synthase